MNLSRHFKLLLASAVSFSVSVTPMAGIGIAHAQSAPAAEAPADSGWQREFQTWRDASKANTVADYQAYLKVYPAGKFASVAKTRISELNGTKTADTTKVVQKTTETADATTTTLRTTDINAGENEAEKKKDLAMWQQVSKTGTQADYEKYLKAFPKGKFAKVAKSRIDAMMAGAKTPAETKVVVADKSKTPAEDETQSNADDQQPAADDTQTAQNDSQSKATDNATQPSDQAQAPASDWEQEYALWKAASDGNTVAEYEAYLKSYPKGKFSAIAQARIVQLAAAEQPASNVDEGDDSQTEQTAKLKNKQPADDPAQADDQAQTDDQNQADDQNRNDQAQLNDQNQTDPAQADQQSDDQNQMADTQTDGPSQKTDMGQNTVRKQPGHYTQGTPDTEDEYLVTRQSRHEIQGRLTSLGYDTFGTDGAFGPNTRNAISAWQQNNGAPVSGYLSGDQIAQIRMQSQVSYAQWLAAHPVVVERPVIVRPRREKIIVEERHPGLDAAIAAGVLGAVVLGGHRLGKFKRGRVPGCGRRNRFC